MGNCCRKSEQPKAAKKPSPTSNVHHKGNAQKQQLDKRQSFFSTQNLENNLGFANKHQTYSTEQIFKKNPAEKKALHN